MELFENGVLNYWKLKDYFSAETFSSLISSIEAYEKKDYLTFLVWAGVFNERLLNDLAISLNAQTKSMTFAGMKKSIQNSIRSISKNEKYAYENVLCASDDIRELRNYVVHSADSVDSKMGRSVYNAINQMCKYYTKTSVANQFLLKNLHTSNSLRKSNDELLLQVTNIGNISNATINIDGLSVIVGENATGKSTIGKALYLIMSLNNMNKRIIDARKNKIRDELERFVRRTGIYYQSTRSYQELVDDLVLCATASVRNILSERIPEVFIYRNKSTSAMNRNRSTVEEYNYLKEVLVDKISRIKSMSNDVLQQEVVNIVVDNLFSGKICKQGTDTGIILLKKDHNAENSITIKKYENGEHCVEVIQDVEISQKACMMDGIYDINSVDDYYVIHDKDVIDAYNARNVTDKFAKILSSLIGGHITISDKEVKFEQNDLPELIQIKNLSSGVKSISQLEWKLRQGIIARNSVLILDEPEISLHPDWQVKYAQIIVKLQKELDLHILVMTHSPYFLQALEYSSKIEGIGSKYHCYLAESHNNYSRISCVDKYPSYAYKKMIEPFAKLDTMRERLEDGYNEN